MQSGDISWLLTSTALVILMTPALGLFYGGMVRAKNVLSTITMCFVALAIVSVQWILLGYTIAFGDDVSGLTGNLVFIGLRNVSMSDYGFVAFQMAFAAITLAIIVSALAERVKLSAFLLFGILWTTFVYDPIAHWVWGNGWLAGIGALDFAGGTVVHISSGFSALALALLVGRRTGYGEYNIEPHNIPMTLLGTALLWFGWFGFNAGSALEANDVALNAFLVTNTSAAMGALSWMFASWLKGKPGSLGVASGAIAGLVAITPAAGYVDPLSALVIGGVAGVVCYAAMLLRVRAGVDESLDAWAVHGVGGLWGAIATGIFASVGATGLVAGNAQQLLLQIIAALVATAYAFLVTLILAKAVDAAVGLRVSSQEEYVGLDLSQHEEVAYT
ncbi:ammonium transporter [Archaeoglobus fulgidus]|uniref:Ammonium transporter n=3 Tax=Archaeoglobus TaxID=2233 RepID=A0A075WEB4_ARCFL|nr:ammonium transporter [Archaeoglobus fulgidus]AIG98750.1 ammonium transporter [Archaeoglobus fulgidus DSM 8774]